MAFVVGSLGSQPISHPINLQQPELQRTFVSLNLEEPTNMEMTVLQKAHSVHLWEERATNNIYF